MTRKTFKMKYENCIEKQTIEYTHTMVPTSMRSPYWKYFGFPADSANNILTRQKIICTLCGTAITYNKNTSNLRTHLIARHQERLHEMHQHQQQRSTVECSSSGDATRALLTKTELTDDNDSVSGAYKRSYITDDGKSFVQHGAKVRRVHVTNMETDADADVETCLSDGVNLQHVAQNPLREDVQPNDVTSISIGAVHSSDYEYFTTDIIEADATSLSNDADSDEAQPASEIEVDCNSRAAPTVNCNTIDIAPSSTHMNPKPLFTYAIDMPPISPVKTAISSLPSRINDAALIADMVVNDLLPTHILRGSSFRQLLHSTEDVSENEVERKILDNHAEVRHKVNNFLNETILQCDKPFSVSLEFYNNVEGTDILSIYINYLNGESDNELLSILYETFVATETLDLTEMLKGLDITRCAAIVATNTKKTIVSKFAQTYSIPVIECLHTLLTRCLQEIFDVDIVKRDFELICKAFQSCTDLPELYLPCPWSKLNFLQAILDTVHAKHEDYQEIFKEFRLFLAYISPLKITLDTVLLEPLPLCTLVRPLITKLVEDHFSSFYTDSNKYLMASKTIIAAEFSHCITENKLWSEATLFDVRFQRDFIQQSTQQQQNQPPNNAASTLGTNISLNHRAPLEVAICKRFQQLIERNNRSGQKQLIKGEKQQEAEDTNALAPKSSLRLFFHRITDAAIATHRINTGTPPPQPKSSIELEFNRYKYEPTLDLEQCPISWWQLHAQHYTQLYKIANFYLCVPCYVRRWPTIVVTEPNERAVLQEKRYALRQQQRVDKCLWYLRYNRKVFDKIKTKE